MLHAPPETMLGGDASGAAHFSEWSLCTYPDRLDWYVQRAMRIVDSTRLYCGTDFSSMPCMPQHLEGGFGKQLPMINKTVCIRDVSL